MVLPNDYREISSGMGQAVAERTILRRKENGDLENWGEVAARVALGNCYLHETGARDLEKLTYHIAQGHTLMSGRHLQHGDATQATRNLEIYSNCSTAPASFMLFYLLLNGSGVGRCYDDDIILVNWDNAPTLRCVLDSSHPDFRWDLDESKRDALHKFGSGSNVIWHEVADSREGWAKALEIWELLTFEKIHANKMLILDFSKVRAKGSPIGGMQNRPASGPLPLISAFQRAATLKGAAMAPWMQSMYVDHYFAECVLVGGARRAARMSTKHWSDTTILEFINIKRPIEYKGLNVNEILSKRKGNSYPPMPFLWSSNNSVTVDAEFWAQAEIEGSQAQKIFNAICESAYGDGTGEPGIVNSDKIDQNTNGWSDLNRGDYIGSAKYSVEDDTNIMLSKLAKRAKKKKFSHIINPCVSGNTLILTDNGYKRIDSVIGEKINIWNGIEWSEVTPFATGINPLMRIKFSDGSQLKCTPYHKFILDNKKRNKEVRTEAKDLLIGSKLFKFSMPFVTEGDTPDIDAYSQGFYSGDGNKDNIKSYLYSPKYACQTRLIGTFSENDPNQNRKTWRHGAMLPKSFVPVNANSDYCLDWLAGIIDSDGTATRDENGNGIQITSINETFLLDIKLMLSRLGCLVKVVKGHNERATEIKGLSYSCQATYRLLIGNMDTFNLLNRGLKCSRVSLHLNKPQRSAQRFITVTSIDYINEEPEETYCFTDSKNNSGTFNGIVTGNCGEIPLNVLGGVCIIGDLVPYHCDTLDEAEDCARVVTRALIRVNLMDSIYNKEIVRTNRIGVGITGVFEFAWKFFGYGFKDLLDEIKSQDFWLALRRLNLAIKDEATKYSKELGMNVPHTMTTVKPSGSVSKLFALTEGWHLPSMREFLRWVQFRNDDPLVQTYKEAGYPVRELQQYSGTTIVGFPTAPSITTLGMGDKLVTAAEATPEEQFQWLKLGEKYFIEGTDKLHYGGQISYTLKYNPDVVGFAEFKSMLLEHQRDVRCCSVMPQADVSSYEYQPEEPVSKEKFIALVENIVAKTEDIGREHLNCDSGGCPVDFSDVKA